MSIRQRFLRVVVLAGLAALLRSETAPATVHASTPPGLVFHTMDPCRVADTRTAGGPVVAGADRTFAIVGPACGVPPTARAVSLNLAVTQPTAAGNVRLYPAGAAVPTVSAINYSAGQTRSNNAVVGLSAADCLDTDARHVGDLTIAQTFGPQEETVTFGARSVDVIRPRSADVERDTPRPKVSGADQGRPVTKHVQPDPRCPAAGSNPRLDCGLLGTASSSDWRLTLDRRADRTPSGRRPEPDPRHPWTTPIADKRMQRVRAGSGSRAQ